MAFDINKFAKSSSGSTEGLVAQYHTYNQSLDTLADIRSSGYFDTNPFLEVGDKILIKGSDGIDSLDIKTLNPTSSLSSGLPNLPTFFWDNDKEALGIGTNTIDDSAILDLVSTERGLKPPQMTETQRDAISSPAEGLHVFNETSGEPNYFNNTWKSYITAGGLPTRLQQLSYGPHNIVTGQNFPTIAFVNGNIPGFRMLPNTDVIWTWKVPPDYVSNSNITINFIWASLFTNTGNVDWKLQGWFKSPGESWGFPDDVQTFQDTGTFTASVLTTTSFVIDGVTNNIINTDYINFQLLRENIVTPVTSPVVDTIEVIYTSQL